MATPDNYSRLSMYWAMSLALISEILYRTVDFWPVPGLQDRAADAARGLLDLFLLPIVSLVILVFLVCPVIGLVLALIGRRFRRALSFASALGAFELTLVIAELRVFDPWFWYVLCNKTRLEAAATVMTMAKPLHIAAIKTWDVFTGLAINPPTFVSVLYDESGEIDNDARSWSPAIKTLYERDILDSRSSSQLIVDRVEHVIGHFFVVRVTTR